MTKIPSSLLEAIRNKLPRSACGSCMTGQKTLHDSIISQSFFDIAKNAASPATGVPTVMTYCNNCGQANFYTLAVLLPDFKDYY